MPTLTLPQAAALCEQVDDLLTTLEGLANRISTDQSVSDDDKDTLDSIIGNVSDLVANCATTVAQAAFDDAADAFTKLKDVTTEANKKAKELAAKVANISKVCKIASAFLGLIAKLGAGNVADIWSAATDLSSAIN